METLQRGFETRRMKANFIRGTGIPIVCHTPAELPLAIAETYTLHKGCYRLFFHLPFQWRERVGKNLLLPSYRIR